MKKIIKYFILFIILSLSTYYANATHIIGGELNYKCLGNNKYEIALTVYRDCFYGQAQFDNPVSIGIFSNDGKLLDSTFIRFVKDDTLTVVLSDTCHVVPKDVCVHTSTYIDTIELQPRVGGYILAYQRCCRNQTILNIVKPLETGATFLVEISEMALKECNSNARFTSWPPIFICVNEELKFDHGATDIDGDSIYYKLCTPFKGASPVSPAPQPPNPPPYDNISWKPPFGLNNILGGIPLTIDPKTGFMTARPNFIGQYVAGVCIDEFRKGKLISTTRRDFQYNVGLCTNPVSAILAPKIQCNELDVFFDNKSISANKFEWDFGEPSSATNISTLETPNHVYADIGDYKIRMIAQPNTACADTTFHFLTLKNSTLKTDFTFKTEGCSDSILLKLTNTTTDVAGPPKSYKWSLRPQNETETFTSTAKDTTFSIVKSGKWLVTLEAIAQNDCPIQITKIVELNFIDTSFQTSYSGCPGDTITLNPEGNPQFEYEWTPSNLLQNNMLVSPTIVIDTIVNLTMKAKKIGENCLLTRNISIVPSPSLSFYKAIAKPDTIYLGKTAQLETTQDKKTSYLWSPAATLSKANIFNPVAKPIVTTTYEARFQQLGFCAATQRVTVVVIKPTCDEPFIYVPNAFTPNFDGTNDELYVRGNNIDKLFFAVYNRWGERVFVTENKDIPWDGTYNGLELPADVYGFYLKLTCKDGENYFKKGNVTLIR